MSRTPMPKRRWMAAALALAATTAATAAFAAKPQDQADLDALEQNVADAIAALEAAKQAQGQGEQPQPDAEPAKNTATYLGISTGELSEDEQAQYNGFGLKIGGATDGSPAANAGLKEGDILTAFDGQRLVNFEQLAVLVRSYGAGDAVEMTIIRDGQEQTVEATLAEHEAPPLGEMLAQLRNANGPQRVQGVQGVFGPGDGQRFFMLRPQGGAMQWRPAEGQLQFRRLEGLGLDRELPMRLQLELNGEELELQMQEMQEEVRRAVEEAQRMAEEQRALAGEARERAGEARERAGAQRERAAQIHRATIQMRRDLADGMDGNTQRRINIRINDDQGIMTFTAENGESKVVVKNENGEVLYDGEMPQTDEQWQALPDGVGERLKKLQDSVDNLPEAPEAPPAPQPASRPQPEKDQNGNVRV